MKKWIPTMDELAELGFGIWPNKNVCYALQLADSEFDLPCFSFIYYLLDKQEFTLQHTGHVSVYHHKLNITSRAQLEAVISALTPQES